MAPFPNIFTLAGLMKAADGTVQTCLPGGRWVPSRPIGWPSIKQRFRAGWLAFTGKADVVIWPENEAPTQGEA